MQNIRKYIQRYTLHCGEIRYFWATKYLHNYEYREKVYAAIVDALDEALDKYDVEQDTQYCSQFEGVKIIGTDLMEVKNACKDIAKVLSKFKGVIPLTD